MEQATREQMFQIHGNMVSLDILGTLVYERLLPPLLARLKLFSWINYRALIAE